MTRADSDCLADATADGAFRVSPIAASREDRRAVVRGSTQFALDVYGRLRSRPGNVVFSPVSLATALALTAESAAGRTRAEIVSALHVPMSRTRGPRAFQSVLADHHAHRSGIAVKLVNRRRG